MNEFNKEYNMKLRNLIGNDKVRFLDLDEVINDPLHSSNQNKEIILRSTTQIDLQSNLSPQAIDVLKNAGSVTRAFNQSSISILHLFYALVHYIDIKKPGNLYYVLNGNISRGLISDRVLRRTDIRISKEVEILLKDSIAITTKKDPLIKPIHIMLQLFRKDFPQITKIIRLAKIDITKLTEELDNEINKSN